MKNPHGTRDTLTRGYFDKNRKNCPLLPNLNPMFRRYIEILTDINEKTSIIS